MFGKTKQSSIGSLFDTTSGGTPSRTKSSYFDGGNIPWLTSSEVGQGLINKTESFITEEGLKNSSAKWVPANSVVVAMYGATVGKVGLLEIPCTTNQAVCSILPNESIIPMFLLYAVKDKEEWMIDQAAGAAQPNISQAVIRKMEIPVPPKEEQIAFVEIAKQADKSKFDGLKSQFIEMFGNPVTNPMGWSTKPLCQVAPESPSNTKMKGRVWVLNLDMIESNSGCIINKVFEDSDDLNSVAAFDEGNVLFSKLRPYLNKVTIPDGKGYATTELVPLRPHTDELRQHFLSFLLRTDEFVKYADGIATGTKMPRMPMTALREFKCILPPTELQDLFCGISKQADKSKFELKQAIEKVDKVMRALMQ